MGKRLVLIVVLLLQSSCASAPVPTTAVIRDPAAPRYFSLPSPMRDHDYVCDNVNYFSTCATVGEVRAFLLSRKAQP